MKQIKDFIKNNWFYLCLFCLSTLYFLIQHYLYVGWDFQVYLLNAKYWLGNSNFFEIGRPPFMSFILMILSIFGSKLTEYIYIILISSLYAYGNYKLSTKLNLNHNLFYLIALNPFILIYGVYDGTELLLISLVILAIYYILDRSILSGLLLSFAALSRYTALLIFPLLFLHLNIKKIIKSLVLFLVPIGVWFIWNFYKYGNFFTSIADQYALNMLFRQYTIQPIQLTHFLEIFNFLIIFFVIGFIIRIVKTYIESKKIIKKSKKNIETFLGLIEKNKIEIIMIFIFLYSIKTYIGTPLKFSRYLYFISIPMIYYSYFGFNQIIIRIKSIFKANKSLITNITLGILLIATIIISSISLTEMESNYFNYDKNLIEDLNNLNLSECSFLTNNYPRINYIGIDGTKFPRENLLNYTINENYKLILFLPNSEPEYASNLTFIEQFPIIKKTQNYWIIGNNNSCIKNEIFDKTYLENLNNELYLERNMNISTNPCVILFHSQNTQILQKFCNWVNLNGFVMDKNQELA